MAITYTDETGIKFNNVKIPNVLMGTMITKDMYRTKPLSTNEIAPPINPLVNVLDIDFSDFAFPSYETASYINTAGELISAIDGMHQTNSYQIGSSFKTLNDDLTEQIDQIDTALTTQVDDLSYTVTSYISYLDTNVVQEVAYLGTELDDLDNRVRELERMSPDTDLTFLSLNMIKKHLNIDYDFSDDDEYLVHLGVLAQAMVERHIDDTIENLKTRFGGEVPKPIVHAALLLIGSMYANREIEQPSSMTQNTAHSYEYLLALYKNRTHFAG